MLNETRRDDSLLATGRNAWVICEAEQASFLIDAAAYYDSLYQQLQQAQKTVFLLGWDIDSRLRLRPGPEGCPGLAELLNQLVRERPELNIYLLLWDFSSIYLFGREPFQSIKLGLTTDARLHFCFDDEHPISASHHQKVVVIDDAVAYCGGIDLTGNRWDTERHLPEDPLRVNPGGASYAPFHDVQMAVTGAPALRLGELCRERWRRATGQLLPAAVARPSTAFDLGPDSLRQAKIGISRTVPAFRGYPEVREAEQLFADMIDAAKETIYIENQYFTSSLICRKLSESLRRPDGPEVVMVLPKMQDSWLAKVTMGMLSMRCIVNLMNSDKYDRFRPCYPEDSRLAAGRYVNVHSKVMIVDGRYARVGSANMNNRSMGLDTECDLLVDAGERPDLRQGVARFLHRLLADHTGSTPDAAAAALATHGSIRGAIEALNVGSPQTLELHLYPERISAVEALVGDLDVVDLDQTVGLEKALDEFVYQPSTSARDATLLRLPERVPAGYFLTFVLCLTLAAALALTPERAEIRAVLQSLLGIGPSTPLEVGFFVVLAFIVAGLAFVPFNLLVVLTASAFPLGRALSYVLLGGMATALVGYAFGRLASRVRGWAGVRRAFAAYAAMVRETSRRPTVGAVFLVRFFPLAPFALMNLVAGAMRVRLGAYLGGTFLGILPGALSLVLFQRSLMAAIRAPTFVSILVFALVTALVTQGFRFLSRRFGSRPERVRYA